MALYLFGPLCLGLICYGCHREFVSHQTTDQLIDLVADNSQPDQQRLLILDNLLAQPLDTQQKAQLGRQLSGIVISIHHSPVIRKRTLDIITYRFSENAPVWLGKALLNTPEPELRDEIIYSLVILKDMRALPYLILAEYEYRPISQSDHPSFIQAIEHIADESLENVLIHEYVSGAELKNKVAALAGLKRHFGPEHTISIIQNLPNNDDLHDLVRFWVDHFNLIPASIPQFFLCQIQRSLISPPQWTDLQQKTAWLKTHYNYQFNIADTYILLQSEKTQFLPPRNEIIDQIARRLASLPHSYRPPSYQGAADDYREDFLGQHNLFSYTDLLRIRLILSTLARPTTVKQLRRLIMEDLDDPATEVAGLCFLDDSQNIRFQTYTPQSRRADNTYVESPQMLRDASMCLTRWHCHADREKSSLLAGPGLDDLKFAEYYGTSLVIITYINAKILNVDFCTAQGEVVDLGNY